MSFGQTRTRRADRASAPPLIVALPGSRRSEVTRLMADFGGALATLQTIGRAVLGRPADPAAY